MKLYQSPVIQLTVLACAVFGAWRVTEAANQRLAAIPVKQPPLAVPAVHDADAKRIFPAAALHETQVAGATTSDLDAVFRPALPQMPPMTLPSAAPPPPDYAGMLVGALRLNGIAHNGAYISGRFYRVGQQMTQLAMPRADGSTLVPTLRAIGTDHVVLNADGANVALPLYRGP